MRNKVVIYTAIFGGKDNLIEPEYIPKGCDFVCFTDQDFVSNVWEVRKVEPDFEDPVRSAKIYKVLPHKYLSEYEVSVWIDGNVLVRGNVIKLIEQYLSKVDLAFFNHNKQKKKWKKLFWIKDKEDCRDCIYDEADYLLKIGKEGKYKDDPEIIKNQIERYQQEGYPKHNGLIAGMVILRRHNESSVIQTMKDWWSEIKKGSRRDQLSFNYVAWKNCFDFDYIKGNVRQNKYFSHRSHLKK